MKKIFIYGLLAVLAPLASSCSDNYLDQKPQASVVPETLFTDPDNAQYAVNGLGKLMCSQYMSSQGRSGEATLLMWMGEWPGNATQKCDLTGWSNTINGKYHENNSNGNMYFAWQYPYQLIVNANTIINGVPTDVPAGETKNKWDFVKAEALTYRAHAYLRLVQVYSRRWSDRNGESRGVVLRLDDSTDPAPCVSLKDIYTQIYKDLDEAIALFQSSGIAREETWMPNEDVAHALYSRAALTREDWAKASSEAKLAQKNYSLMGQSEYEKGFNTPNKEWIWCVYNSETQDIYYYSFFAYMASNSKSSSCRTTPLTISRALVEQIPASDTRLKLYAIPTASEMPKYPSLVSGSGKVVSTSAKTLASLQEDINKETDPKKKKNLQESYENYVQMNEFYNRVKGSSSFIKNRLYSSTNLYYYMNTKFQAIGDLGIGQVCISRMAEMLYNEAEAEYKLGNEPAAIAALEKAVKPYQSGYKCTKSGDALYKEICLYREFDLAGEGFSWFDMKRRGETLDRKNWQNGGSWNNSFAVKVAPADLNRWTFCIPNIETNYNDKVTSFEDDNWTPGSK